MARLRLGIDKTKRPEYMPITIWENYQEAHDKPEYRITFERLIFGDDKSNSQRSMQRTWLAIEEARLRRWNDFLKQSGDRLLYESEDFDKKGVYGALAMHVRSLATMQGEDFSKLLTPAQKASQLREIVSVGKRFFSLIESCYLHKDYFSPELNFQEMETLITSIRNESKIQQLLQELRWDIAHQATLRDLQTREIGYFYSDECAEKSKARHMIIEEYEQAVLNDIVPLLVKYIPGNWPVSLSEHIGKVLESVEDEAAFVRKDSCILPKVNIKDPKQIYMIRYLSDSFYSMFGENSLVMPLGRMVGAVLCKEITREDVKNALKGYPRYGIRRSFRGELEEGE